MKKTKEQLINELLEIRQRIVELEASAIRQKEVEKALQKSEQRFKQIAESSGEFIWEVDVNGLYTYANPVVEEILGYKPDEIIGKKYFYDFFHPDIREILKKAAFEVFEKKTVIRNFINPNIHKNGNTVILETSGLPVIDNQGNLLGYRGSDRDITVRKKAEEALRVSEEKYRTVANFTYDWEDWMDPNGKYIYVSPSCEWISGYHPDKFMADPDLVIKITHPDDRDLVQEHFREILTGSIAIHHIDFRIITCSGKTRWICHYCQPVYSKDGKFIGRRGSSRDITERKQTEEKIQKLNKELELKVFELTEANKELDAFNYSVSHDLKVPLVIIGGFINRFLKKHSDKLDTKEKDMFHAIQEHTQEMERLIKDLLAFSHVGRQNIKTTEIDIGNLVNTILDELKPLSEGRMIKYDIKTLLTVYGDQALIKQVFINLISNAIKFTTNKKMAIIEVGSWTEENENVYYVKDNGMGFNSQDSDKLFNIFQRLHGIAELEGSGIGLSIVQRIVNKHGGRVWAEGKVNEGSSFYFSLPNKILEDS